MRKKSEAWAGDGKWNLVVSPMKIIAFIMTNKNQGVRQWRGHSKKNVFGKALTYSELCEIVVTWW